MFKKKFGIITLILCVVLIVGYFVVNTGAVSTVLLAIQGAITDGNLVKFSGNNGIGVDTGLSATNVVKCKFDATIAPTINNDISEGYTVGSRWLDITNLKSYVCLDNTDGAAVWIENVVEGDMNKATYDTDEDGDIDVAAGGTEKSLWTLYAIPYLSGTTIFGEIPIGTAGQVLKVNTGATGYEFANEGGGASTFVELTDTPANYTGSSLKFARVNAGETALEFAAEADPNVDTDAEIKAILVDEVTKTGDFTAGRVAKINNATGIIEQGTNTDTDVADAVTKKHTQNTDTDLDATFEATFVKKVDTVNVLSDITSAGADIEDAVTKKHSQNTDTTLIFTNALASDHIYSGEVDSQPVGESVVFGDLLYFNWTDKEWKKTDADAAATMPGLRIALESKADGQACLMLVKGYIRDDSAFEFAGAMIYTSVTPGAMSSTAPTETGDQIQRVGVAKSADILFFDPSIDVGEI